MNRFKTDFAWEVLTGLPANTQVLNYPRNKRVYEEGFVVKVSTANDSVWIGNFHGVASDYISAVFTTPNPQVICVVADGSGFIVDVENPEKYSEIPITPITDAKIAISSNLLILAGFTNIVAYDQNGLMWESPRISMDGLQITEISGSSIFGLAWDPAEERDVEFIVDLNTGNYEGGSYPHQLYSDMARQKKRWWRKLFG